MMMALSTMSTSSMSSFEELVAAHQQKYREVHICDEMPDYRDLPHGTVIGIVAYTHEPSKTRWILRSAQVTERVTASDAARLWLQASYKLPLKRRRDQFAPADLPLLAKPGIYPNCAYLDIKSTYRSIINAFGYDVEYRKMRYLSPEVYRPPMPELIAANKRAYASVIALSASYESVMQRWDANERRLRTIKVRNVYHNPCLWSLTRDILLGVYSNLFWNVELLYANTDGYIVHTRDAETTRHIVESWGFRCAVKAQGDAVIKGIGSYQIGTHKTLRATSSERTVTRPFPTWNTQWIKRHAKWHLLNAAYRGNA